MQMEELNKIGTVLGTLSYVKALTDVTGFGLFGHLIEMCDGSMISAEINPDAFPTLPNVKNYLRQDCFPGGTKRNLASYQDRIETLNDNHVNFIGADPQTSGGLLIAVDQKFTPNFEAIMKEQNQSYWKIGKTINQKEKAIYFK